MQKLVLLGVLAGVCWQCKSTRDPDPTPPVITKTKTELLTGKNWKLTAATINPAYDYFGQQRLITNIYSGLSACQLSEQLRYDLPNVLTLTYDCPNPGFTYTGPYEWLLSNSETVLTRIYAPYYADETYTIEALTETTLVLVQQPIKMGTAYTIRFTYTKQ
jgi:hypothetical protein